MGGVEPKGYPKGWGKESVWGAWEVVFAYTRPGRSPWRVGAGTVYAGRPNPPRVRSGTSETVGIRPAGATPDLHARLCLARPRA